MPIFTHNMIKTSEIKKIVNDYSDVKIGVLGSHSALEVMDGAKDENFETTVFCQKGREGPYQRFNRIADQIVVLDKFKMWNKLNKNTAVINEVIDPGAYLIVPTPKNVTNKNKICVRHCIHYSTIKTYEII